MGLKLTELQKDLARFIAKAIQSNQLKETVTGFDSEEGIILEPSTEVSLVLEPRFTIGEFEALGRSGLIILRKDNRHGFQGFTVTGDFYSAVGSNFEELGSTIGIQASLPNPPLEIRVSLDRLRNRLGMPQKLGFLIMRFAAEKPYERIVAAIKETAKSHGLMVVRADEYAFHANLLNNVKTYLHGCGFGIAIYERITTDEPNANVGLEVGYLMAMDKPVLLLKDKTVPTLPSDLAGELFKEFDPHDPERTIPGQVTKWLEDYGLIDPAKP